MAQKRFLSGIDLASQQIKNVADGSVASDGATYGQLLNLVNGKDYKNSVAAASTANITITAPGTTMDGVTLSNGMRLLLKDQTTASQNGIWVFNGSAAALTRPADFPTGSTGLVEQGATVVVDGGTNNIASQWTLTTTGAITVDTTSLVFTRTTAAGASYTAGNGLSLTSGTFSVKLPASSGLIEDGTGLYIDPSIVPAKPYAANVGDGSSTAITVTHNKGTRDVIVCLYDASTYVEVVTDVVHTTTNTITLNFAVAPASNAYRVVVFG